MYQKGKQAIPYLLSTTKTLARCKRYYYTGLDFKYTCRRNRDCYTERNVRINITRQWHNVIVPNAILCRMYGKPATYREALEALNYAMSNGKTKRSLEAWDAVCAQERQKNGGPDSIVYKFRKSFHFYALGQGLTRDGLIYQLPKAKLYDIGKYITDDSISRFIWTKIKCWVCPWKDLNMLVDAYKHHLDKYDDRCKELKDHISMLERQLYYTYGDQRTAVVKAKKEAEDLLASMEEPDFPATQRAIVEQYHVSMTSAARFLHWKKQLAKTDYDLYIGHPSKIRWAEPADEADGPDFVDTAETDSVPEDPIDSAIQSVINSGERAIGRWDGSKDEPSDLPF